MVKPSLESTAYIAVNLEGLVYIDNDPNSGHKASYLTTLQNNYVCSHSRVQIPPFHTRIPIPLFPLIGPEAAIPISGSDQ
jgi:hypothetical protein